MEEVLERAVAHLRARPEVRLVYLFGSAARGEAGPGSDLDLGVLIGRRLAYDEERLLRADLADVAPEVDLVLLDGAVPALLFEVIDGGRCVFARDGREQAEFELRGLSRFLDFQPFRRAQDRWRRERVEARRAAST